MKRIRMLVDTTEDVRRLVKAEAARQGITMGEFVHRALSRIFSKKLKGK